MILPTPRSSSSSTFLFLLSLLQFFHLKIAHKEIMSTDLHIIHFCCSIVKVVNGSKAVLWKNSFWKNRESFWPNLSKLHCQSGCKSVSPAKTIPISDLILPFKSGTNWIVSFKFRDESAWQPFISVVKVVNGIKAALWKISCWKNRESSWPNLSKLHCQSGCKSVSGLKSTN